MTNGRRRPAPVGRPERGLGHYLRDAVYGASDGVVTTLAVLAGTMGASFPPRVGLILGLANLVADGLSMAASNYLGLRSELEQTGSSVAREMPWRHGLATLLAFVVAGAMPLLAYLAPGASPRELLGIAVVLSAATLALVGAGRARFVGKPVWRAASEVVAVAMLAAAGAYAIALLGSELIADRLRP